MNKFTNILSLLLASAALIVSIVSYNQSTQAYDRSNTAYEQSSHAKDRSNLAFERSTEAMQQPLAAIEALTEMMPTATSSASVADAEADEIAKVVYHVDYSDPRRFSAMLTSINNMATTFENEMIDFDIRMVFVAHGIRFVTDDKLIGTPFAEDEVYAKKREELKGRLLALQEMHDVKLETCNITRQQVGLNEDKLYPGAYTVPSGVVRLAQLQSKGFSYIKIE